MKSIIFALILFTSVGLWAAPLKVIIDPGHGGTDSGAVQGEAKEAEIALNVSLHLQQLLKQDPQFSSLLTRQTDKSLSLQERVTFAEKNNGDLYLSIHANASNDQRARGVEFYFQNHLPADEETLFLANAENKVSHSVAAKTDEEPSQKGDVKAILDDLKRTQRMSSSLVLSKTLLHRWQQHKKDPHAVRQAPFFVVSKVEMPSVLVELGFITNPQEAVKLLSKDYQKEIAHKIYMGLKDYKESMDKSPSQRLQ